MILAIDVDYKEKIATIAGVSFDSWSADKEDEFFISKLNEIEPYVPGSFYKRELPCILHLLNEHQLTPKTIIVDGFVQLDGQLKMGLGAHLYKELNEKVVIIGVAKKAYKGIPKAHEILRGDSAKPLYITALGIELEDAKHKIESMHGKHRFPTLLKSVDRYCRDH